MTKFKKMHLCISSWNRRVVLDSLNWDECPSPENKSSKDDYINKSNNSEIEWVLTMCLEPCKAHVERSRYYSSPTFKVKSIPIFMLKLRLLSNLSRFHYYQRTETGFKRRSVQLPRYMLLNMTWLGFYLFRGPQNLNSLSRVYSLQ